MQGFKRRRGKIVATFGSTEAGLIADLVDQVRTMLSARRAEAPDDPLAELTGINIAPSTPPEDPAIARLLPDFHQGDDDLAAALRVLHEPDLIAAKDAAAVALLDSLPLGGGTVRLTDEQADLWLAALNDVRLALGVRLGITTDDGEPDLERPEMAEVGVPMYNVYGWLSAIQDSLVNAVMD